MFMYLIKTTTYFEKWLRKLKDKSARARILMRIKQVEQGSLGNVKSVGDKIHEFKISHGPGYRLYFSRKGNVIILLLNGGDKSTQSSDIKKAKVLLKDIGVEDYE